MSCLKWHCVFVVLGFGWIWAQAQEGTAYAGYPDGLEKELVHEKGVQSVEVVNDAWAVGFEADRLVFDSLGNIVQELSYWGNDKGYLTEYTLDRQRHLIGKKQYQVSPFDHDNPFAAAEKTLTREEKFEYGGNGSKSYVKSEAGKWALAKEELHYRYLEGKPTQIEFRTGGALSAMQFEVFDGEPEPRYPDKLPIEINRYDSDGELVHQTSIEAVQMLLSVDDDPADFPPDYERTEKHFRYHDGMVTFYSDSSFYKGKFDSHYSFKAVYDASGRPLQKRFQYDRDQTYLQFKWVYEDLRIIETRTTDIPSFAAYKETETFLNEGGLPSKIIEKEGNGGKGIYRKIVRTEYKYTFHEP